MPGLADWAVVSLDGNEGPSLRQAIAHRDPDVEQRLARVAADLARPLVVDPALLDQPLLLDDPLDWTVSRGDGLAGILREGGARSVLLLPLRARGKTLGTLALMRVAGGDV